MKNKSRKSHIEGLLVLLLFGIFAICILSVLLTGAGAYKRLMESGQEAFLNRTVPQYITTKVHQADVAGAVSVTEFGEVTALELQEQVEDAVYITRIYSYDGYIRELFSESTVEFCPADGEKIVEAEAITFLMGDGWLEVLITGKNGATSELWLSLRSTKEAGR